jgi:GrpB-like predicted nucleotidyltransferase (UPF0157 family)
MVREVRVVPYGPRWTDEFEREAQRLRAVFGEDLVEVHHVGSTAVPGLAAKPIIDILPVVRDINLVDALNGALAGLGYTARGEFGLPGRRYFTRDENGVRTHNVHVYGSGDPEIERHLAFRDYMAAHPEEARAYGRLKEELARRFPTDLEAYMDGKDAFVQKRERRALAWERETGR